MEPQTQSSIKDLGINNIETEEQTVPQLADKQSFGIVTGTIGSFIRCRIQMSVEAA